MTGAELRASILQAAVQGKLVPQDPNDEPACVLLERIREERRELVKQKKAKAPRGGESVITRYPDGTVWEQRGKCTAVEITDEVPFDIPDGWEWARLEMLAEYKKGPFGSALTKSMFIPDGPSAVKVYEQRNAIEKDWTLSRYYIPAEYYEKLRGFTVVPGNIIVSCAGTIGESYIVPEGARIGIINQALMRIALYDKDIEEFYLMYFDFLLKEEARLSSKGSAIKNIPPFAILKNMLMPIPPLAEQRRISSKLDELMLLVERYDKLDRERTELNADIEGAMRASILQAAVQGQLTEREDGDEPASKLLERIREERRELVKQKRAKVPRGGESVITRYPDGTVWEQRGKGVAVEITDEVPFDIPDGWEWARLEMVTSYIQRGKSPRYSLIAKYPVVAQKCNQWAGFSLEKAKFVDPDTVPSYGEERILRDGDLLWNSTGLGTLGRMAVYDSRVNEYGWAVADSHVTVIRTCSDWLSYRYAFAYFSGPSVQSVIEDKASGSTKQKELNQETVKKYLIPIPPLAEQQRIVAKLDELLPKTEKLGKLVS